MDSNGKHANILIIDDDPVYRRLSRSILGERFNVYTAELPSLGFEILKNERIDFIICDYKLPEMDGLMVLEKVKMDYPDTEVIMISDSGNMDTVINALRKGAADYFKKPFSASELWMAIERTRKFAALSQDLFREKKKNTLLKAVVNKEIGVDIIGSSRDIQDIKKQMEMVAQTPDTSVLIIGESGTGKELVARGIHNMSNRCDDLFGAVNMSAIPENLFESEFFGHKKGSFTGAIADKAGWFETANKGTLFLDEIGEMGRSLQVKLLRVLEDRSYNKVGAQTRHCFDIRILAATNKPVEMLSNGKDFRLDLFHRLGTFIIELPPLRDRREDIPELAEHFLTILSEKMGKHIDSIHPKALDMFYSYSFPGNLREMKNIIERAIIICNGRQLMPKHFNMLSNTLVENGNSGMHSYDLREIEKKTIMKALQKTNYNKAEASRLLNLEWNALYRRIQKYGIEVD